MQHEEALSNIPLRSETTATNFPPLRAMGSEVWSAGTETRRLMLWPLIGAEVA